jgi:hypothetical protein
MPHSGMPYWPTNSPDPWQTEADREKILVEERRSELARMASSQGVRAKDGPQRSCALIFVREFVHLIEDDLRMKVVVSLEVIGPTDIWCKVGERDQTASHTSDMTAWEFSDREEEIAIATSVTGLTEFTWTITERSPLCPRISFGPLPTVFAFMA